MRAYDFIHRHGCMLKFGKHVPNPQSPLTIGENNLLPVVRPNGPRSMRIGDCDQKRQPPDRFLAEIGPEFCKFRFGLPAIRPVPTSCRGRVACAAGRADRPMGVRSPRGLLLEVGGKGGDLPPPPPF